MKDSSCLASEKESMALTAPMLLYAVFLLNIGVSLVSGAFLMHIATQLEKPFGPAYVIAGVWTLECGGLSPKEVVVNIKYEDVMYGFDFTTSEKKDQTN